MIVGFICLVIAGGISAWQIREHRPPMLQVGMIECGNDLVSGQGNCDQKNFLPEGDTHEKNK